MVALKLEQKIQINWDCGASINRINDTDFRLPSCISRSVLMSPASNILC